MPERVENSMVVDGWWNEVEYGVKRGACPGQGQEEPKGRGWVEMGTRTFIPEEDAFDYAVRKLEAGTEEERQEFVEFFYSGNYIYREG